MRQKLEWFNRHVTAPIGWAAIIIGIVFLVMPSRPQTTTKHGRGGHWCQTMEHIVDTVRGYRGKEEEPTEAVAMCKAYPNEEVCKTFAKGVVKSAEVMDCFSGGFVREKPWGNKYCPRPEAIPVDELDKSLRDSAGDLLDDPTVRQFAGKVTAEDFARLYHGAQYFLGTYLATKASKGKSEDDDLLVDLGHEIKQSMEEEFAPFVAHLPQPTVSDEMAFKQFAGMALGVYREVLALVRQNNVDLVAKLSPECEALRGQKYQPVRCVALAELTKPAKPTPPDAGTTD
ncbi:MAG: hypothetical protein V1908_00775 [Candidatus Peregrinibacteria bacterium]